MNAEPLQNPFLFVVGCPRSGTTLLQRMLDAHPELAVANDTHFIPRALEEVAPECLHDPAVRIPPSRLPVLVSWVKDYHRFSRLGLPDPAVRRCAAAAQSYREFVSLLYTEFASMRGKPRGGEKTPDYVRRLRLLHGLFPWAKVLHIIRDGRDVALSTLEWARQDKGPGRLGLWREDPVAVCALWWKWQVGAGLRARSCLSPYACLELKYEELVLDPEGTLRAVMDFLHLPFSERMLNFNQGKVCHKVGLSAKKAWLPPTPGLRDWKSQMEEVSVELFEALAGDLLLELGYPLRFHSTSEDVKERAERSREWWNWEVESVKKGSHRPEPSRLRET